MTSRSLFFDILKENFIRRMWTFAVTTLLFFFALPIYVLLMADNYLHNELMSASELALAKANVYRAFAGQAEADGGMFIYIVLLAVIIGVTGFSYLHSRKKTDFYHSLPVGRELLFAVTVTNSVLMVAVPYLVMSVLAAVITSLKTGYMNCMGIALINFIAGMCYFLFIFMTAVLAMMLTGMKRTGLMGTVVFLFYGPVVVSMIFGCMQAYYWSYYPIQGIEDKIMAYTSPAFWIFFSDAGTAVKAIVSLAGAVLLGALSLILYRRRSLETAENPMSFKRIEAPVKILITIPAAVMAGLMFGSLTQQSDVWTVFAMVCGAVIVHGIIEIIYNSDFRKLFANRIHLAGCGIIALAIFAFFRFDVIGYDRYLPDASKVSSAGIYSYVMENIYGSESDIMLDDDGDIVYGNMRDDKDVIDSMQITDTANVSSVAASAIETIKEASAQGAKNYDIIYSSNSGSGSDSNVSVVIVGWHLKNGRTVYRQYYMNLSKVHDEIESIHDSAEFKQAVYPILNKSEDEVSDMVGVNYQDIFGAHHININADEQGTKDAIKELYDTYCAELTALTAETRRHSCPVASLQFKSSAFQGMADEVRKKGGYLGFFNNIGYYPVYPSFKNTIALMEKYGAVINNGLSADDISAVVISDSSGYTVNEDGQTVNPKPDLIVTDKKQIQELLDSAAYSVGSVDNGLDSIYYNLSITAHLNNPYMDKDSTDMEQNITETDKEPALEITAYEATFDSYYAGYDSGSMSNISFNLEAESIPDFVKNYFEITDEQLSVYTGSQAW